MAHLIHHWTTLAPLAAAALLVLTTAVGEQPWLLVGCVAALIAAVLANALIGALMSLGIGNYAPCMAVIYSLGVSPRVAFPIMAGSAAIMMPLAALRFWKSGRFDRRISLGLAVGGIPGVLIAVYIVKELPVQYLLWMVVGVLVYTSATLWSSSKADAPVAA